MFAVRVRCRYGLAGSVPGINRMTCTGRLRRVMSSYNSRNCSPVVLSTACTFTNARPLTVLPSGPWGVPETSEYMVAEKSTDLISCSWGYLTLLFWIWVVGVTGAG